MTITADDGVRALLADGRVVLIRPLGPADEAEVAALHARLSERDRYLRFFSPSAVSAGLVAGRMTRPAGPGHAALGAYLDAALVGVANYEALADPTSAEIAFAVDRTAQAHGVGTLLLEHLAAVAWRAGVRRIVADVLAENGRMIQVLADAGLPYRMSVTGPERDVELRLEFDQHYLDAVADRERRADTASLTTLLRPRSVVVVGASRRTDAVGNAVLRNLIDGRYPGTLYAVNPHADRIAGVPCCPAPDRLPEAPDLAVVCVPAAAVPDALEACGRRGARAAVVITAGLSGSELGTRALDAVRRHGMRLVGPNCIGIANTAIGLDATFVRGELPAGQVGMVTQSGGVGIALVELLRRLGLGLSTLVSTGDKYDVSGNDLLMWWQNDDSTAMAVLYLESFGNPRKFARVARALARTKPVLAVRSATSPAAQLAAASHTAAAATPAVTRDALFEQAGVIAVDSVSELADLIATLSWQPLPAGNRVAVLSNAGGTGVLAADACVHYGLIMAEPGPETIETLRALLSTPASLRNPIDTGAVISGETFGGCLGALLDDPAVDAVVAAGVPTALGDPLDGIAEHTSRPDKPVLVVRPGQLESVTSIDTGSGSPATVSFADPAPAAAALARIARYAAWRRDPAGAPVRPDGVDLDTAHAVIRDHLTEHPTGGWLDPRQVERILHSFGLPILRSIMAADADAAAQAFTELGGPVVMKAIADDVLHKSAAGGVLLDLRDEPAVREAVATLRSRFGPALRGVLLQSMAARGRELIVGINADEVFGPLVVFGLGGVDTDLIADRAARLAPLSEQDIEAMLHGLRSSATLFAQLPDGEIRDVLRRISALAEQIGEIAELDLNPVILTGERCVIVDARIRVAPHTPTDPFLRRLRN